MKVRRLLSKTLETLAPEDTVEVALARLLEQGVAHLPVVDEGGALVGMISEEQLLEAPDAGAPVRSFLGARPVSVHPGVHVFDATRAMVRHDLSLLPLTEPPSDTAAGSSVAGNHGSNHGGNHAGDPTDAPERYLGVVRRHDLFDRFAQMLSTQEPGAILALESAERDYSLGQLVHLIEQSDAKVRSVSSEPASGGENDPRRVTVKLNTTDTTRVRHMLEHHGFDVAASFGEQDEDVLERVQEFMRYLEV
jgi:CBS domain-containing protein